MNKLLSVSGLLLVCFGLTFGGAYFREKKSLEPTTEERIFAASKVFCHSMHSCVPDTSEKKCLEAMLKLPEPEQRKSMLKEITSWLAKATECEDYKMLLLERD